MGPPLHQPLRLDGPQVALHGADAHAQPPRQTLAVIACRELRSMIMRPMREGTPAFAGIASNIRQNMGDTVDG